MALIPPFFLDCVVAIGFQDGDQTSYAATGFLFGRLETTHGDQKSYRIFLVTNRHVIDGQKTAILRFNPEGSEPAREYDLPLLDGANQPLWKAHSDPQVDLAIIGVNAVLLQEHGIRFSFVQSDAHVVTLSDTAQVGVAEGIGVFVLGFPMGLIGGARNFVIVRHGVIARIQDAVARLSSEILLDVTVFPGNSGGPVFTRPEALALEGTPAFGRAALLGVVRGYVPYQDVAISAQTKRPRVIFEENSGLTSVVPVDYLLQLVEQAVQSTLEVPTPVDNTNPTPASPT